MTAPSAVAAMRSIEINSVAARVDCITTSVAIAAQYASGNPNSRAAASDTVAATAVRIECTTDGRFCGSHFHSFTETISRRNTRIGKTTLQDVCQRYNSVIFQSL